MAIESNKKKKMLHPSIGSHSTICKMRGGNASISNSYSLESLSTCELRMSPLEIVRDLTHDQLLTEDCRSKISMAQELKSTIIRLTKAEVKHDVKFL